MWAPSWFLRSIPSLLFHHSSFVRFFEVSQGCGMHVPVLVAMLLESEWCSGWMAAVKCSLSANWNKECWNEPNLFSASFNCSMQVNVWSFKQAKEKMTIQGETHYQSNPKEGIRMQWIKVRFPIFQSSIVFIHNIITEKVTFNKTSITFFDHICSSLCLFIHPGLYLNNAKFAC